MWVGARDGGYGGVYACFTKVVMEAVNGELEGGGGCVTMSMEMKVSFTGMVVSFTVVRTVVNGGLCKDGDGGLKWCYGDKGGDASSRLEWLEVRHGGDGEYVSR
ncbi:hypothetical protein L1987_43167 [Smallanthus sonchifolius]|uniref:Uncharacterized protein n=1 Tax=Smallanthus sonchifolius TaxID=185202 RepID=A0ACB9GLW2_9ASTR|nr:hypothetical protein L1987_43167 [Smallanthus sonchifolius]